MRLIGDISEYHADDIRVGDRVLDIGANAGAFSIHAAKYTWKVTAVEPVTIADLKHNISRRSAFFGNIQVIEGALGDGRPLDVTWDDMTVTVPSFTLAQLIDMAGGCTFLKCDCEGAEWMIDPKDLKGIRRIEMELHAPPISDRHPDRRLMEYLKKHYRYNITGGGKGAGIGVMGVIHAYEI